MLVEEMHIKFDNSEDFAELISYFQISNASSSLVNFKFISNFDSFIYIISTTSLQKKRKEKKAASKKR